MLSYIYYFFAGYLILRVEGSVPERFLNLCNVNRIPIWGVERQEGAVYVRIGIKAFPKLREVLSRSRCRVRVVRRAGLPFRYGSLFSRAMMLPGMLLCVLLLAGASMFVWDVDVTGIENEPLSELIRGKVLSYGAVPGTLKREIDLNKLERLLAKDVPYIRYAGIRIQGYKIVVDVRETYQPPAIIPMQEPADIVADTDAVVDEVLALRGTSLVKKGDLVRAGDVLISSYVPSLVEGRPGRFVHSQGGVIARVWYKGEARADLDVASRVPSGRSETLYVLKAAFSTFGEDICPYADFARSEKVYQLGLFPPVSLLEITYTEYISDREGFDDSQLKEVLRLDAENEAMLKLPADARVVDKFVDFSIIEERILVAEVHLEVLEDIGVEASPKTTQEPEEGSTPFDADYE